MTPHRLLLLLLATLTASQVQASPHLPLTDDTIHEAVQLWTSNDATNLQSIQMLYGPIEEWDVSRVTNMNRLFRNALSFDADLSMWNTASVTDMELMFYGASSFTHDLSKWNVSNVQNLAGMFVHASSYNVSLCWSTLGEFVFLEDIFCATDGAKFDPCCDGIPLYYVRASCCTADNCDVSCPTAPSVEPTTTPTTSPSQQPSLAPLLQYTFFTSARLPTNEPSVSPTQTPTTSPSSAPSTAPSTSPTKALNMTTTPFVTLVGQSLNLTQYQQAQVWIIHDDSDDEDLDDNATAATVYDQDVVVSVQVQEGKRNYDLGNTQNNSSQSGSSGWKGALAGTMVGLVVCAVLVAVLVQRRRQQQQDKRVDDFDSDCNDDDHSLLLADEERPEVEMMLPVCSEPPISIEHQCFDMTDVANGGGDGDGDGAGGEAVELSFDTSYLDFQDEIVNDHEDEGDVIADAYAEEDKYQLPQTRERSGEGHIISKVILEDVRQVRLN